LWLTTYSIEYKTEDGETKQNQQFKEEENLFSMLIHTFHLKYCSVTRGQRFQISE
jgi:hypothetical protein